ncbi:zinc finger protein DZIP1L [Megalops cyprinoides]|uniref:zinc finger protein DZIP1L n=1 Tax=Megalops cyprinoides TaxID=118141 RepID=UPI001864924F|nr:zinc finger protein DZIP1L [Megalops cyprinoides]
MPGQFTTSEVLSPLSGAPLCSPGLLQPFRFRSRRELIDWRRLSSLDVGRVAREMDVAVLQEHINAVTFCDVDAECCPHCRRPVDPVLLKVLRMSQLSTEYLLHCQDYLSAQLAALEERLQGALTQVEQEGKERARLYTELQAMRQESHHRKKMITMQQLLLQAGASSYHKCQLCEKVFINYSFLQAHLQRRHPDVTDSESEKKRQVEEMEDGIKELRERLTQYKLEVERGAEAFRRQQELERQQKKESNERLELENWKEEEKQKCHMVISDQKQLLLQEFKDISSQSSSIEGKLQELQTKGVTISNLGMLCDEDEQDGGEDGERQLKEKIAQQKRKWRKKLQEIQNGHLVERQELQNENERLRMSLSADQKSALQSLKQQISSLVDQVEKKEKLIQSQEHMIKKLSARPVTVSASPIIQDGESSEEEELENFRDSRQRWLESVCREPSFIQEIKPILEENLEDKLESLGLRKGTRGISRQTFRSLSSLVAAQRQQKAVQLSDLQGLRARLTREMTHRVRRLQRSQGASVPTPTAPWRTYGSLKKSPKPKNNPVKPSPKQVKSQAPQTVSRLTVPSQIPHSGQQRNSPPSFSSEEDSVGNNACIMSPGSKSVILAKVMQSRPSQTHTANTKEDWLDTELSKWPISPNSHRTPQSQGNVIQSPMRGRESHLTSPMTKPVGRTRVTPPKTTTSHKPSAVTQLVVEDSDLELSSVEKISPQSIGGQTPRAHGSADSTGSLDTSVWSSSVTQGGMWYRNEILRPIVRPYTGTVGPGFLLVQDNARTHVARVCRQFLDDEGIDYIDWPSCSPDLNPIEDLWDVMYRCI